MLTHLLTLSCEHTHTHTQTDNLSLVCADLSVLCISNVARDSKRLWVHLVATYAFSLLMFFAIRRNYKEVRFILQHAKG